MKLLRRRTRLCVLLATAFLPACATAAWGQSKLAVPLPDDVVAAWRKAGGKIGTMWVFQGSNLVIAVPSDGSNPLPSQDGQIPGFYLGKWPSGVATKLPQPQSPFGLLVQGDFAEADLKDLVGLKNLQMLSLFRASVTGVGFKDLAGLKKLQSLSLMETGLDDTGLKELAKLNELRTLDLTQNSNITDAGLKKLLKLKRLQVLSISNTKATDAGLKALVGLEELHTLDIGSTKVTSAGLKELAAMKSLRKLGLVQTRITDADLKVLADLKGLEELDLRGNRLTKAGVAELQKALPNLKIDRSELPRTGLGSLETDGADEGASKP